MRDEHGRDPEPQLDAADLVAQLHAHLRIERRERFVEQQHLGFGHQRSCECHALLLAAGELVGEPIREVGEADQGEGVDRAP